MGHQVTYVARANTDIEAGMFREGRRANMMERRTRKFDRGCVLGTAVDKGFTK